MDHKIELKNITKQIRKNTVLDNVSCSFSSGEVTGLVGVNGSGKTMLMRIITGLCVPTEGEALIDGRKLHKDISFPSSCGLLLETPAFIDSFTGFENLKMLAIEDINDPDNYKNSIYKAHNYITRSLTAVATLPYIKSVKRFIGSQGHKLMYEYTKYRERQE